jgi:hypothetical protein
MTDDEKPGYKRPPKAKQFKAGTSGNPRGRPKGSRNLKTDLSKLLNKRITVREDGEVRKISRQEAILLGLFSQALRGDAKATSSILAMCMKFDPPSEMRKQTDDGELSEADQEIIDDYLRRKTEEKKKDHE